MNHDLPYGDDGGAADAVTCPMITVFHNDHCERILFEGWVARTVPEFTLACLAFFLLAFSYEGLKFVREYMLLKSARKTIDTLVMKQPEPGQPNSLCHNTTKAGFPSQAQADTRHQSYLHRISTKPHLIQTLINSVQVALSYLLMLVFMTCNLWLCAAVVFGFGVGFFCFGWIKRNVYDIECCA